MSERALYAVRSEGGQWLSYGGWEDGLVCGAAYDNLADATEDAADHGGEVVALVPLTAAQERDLQAMAALREHGLSACTLDGAEWEAVRLVWYEQAKGSPRGTEAADPAEAILAAAAKLEEAKAKA